jgi:hypothetical protein
MARRTGRIASVVVLAVGVMAFAGTAAAGNGHGNGNANGQGNGNAQGNGNGNAQGNGNGKPDPAPAADAPAPTSPGNSGSAPGHEKADETVSTPTTTPAPATPPKPPHPGHGKGKPSAPSSPAPGIEPSNSTAKNTDAPAGSNRTKSYGNGSTAGQIARSHGYPASGNLHGPGNSQPHKVVTCGHRHGVDVHALKSHRATGPCGAPSPTPTPSPNPPPNNPPGDPQGLPSTPSSPSITPISSTPTPSTPTAHGPSAGPRDPGGGSGSKEDAARALGAVASELGGQLPFTGVRLWMVVLGAIGLVVVGGILRSRGRSPAA